MDARAARVLRGELNIHLDIRPVYLRRPAHAPPEGPPEGQGQAGADEPRVLELTCNGVAVPFEMSLATVKKYIWRKGDDLIFNYRIRNPAQPAPLPVLTPGG
ncbi:hypothetical protein GPECTOR_6g810 [Gonium pectorale]|uniref:Uncharacterized protein n=1 Tax=Gonium pectorale TaxID=33097 RepID=A0A150GVZ8_GONPE|nr:hypothetical protein GPECTOR_6g810 [Gonium pectorale]|eukprot:KXZ53892.1 hypothetical protein GPECTOR_6g810 [Gonium pectorale]